MAKVLVTGATGFLGGWVVPALAQTHEVILWERAADLRSLKEAWSTLMAIQPRGVDAVVHLAYPGSRLGIETSERTPLSLAADLLRIDANVIEGCARLRIPKLLCVGSACEYPVHTSSPTNEDDLWHGPPEPVNEAYGMAKRMQHVLLRAARTEYGLNGIHVILGNLYGPGDRTAHVIPALITKVRRALLDGGPVVVWGRPGVSRNFLHVADAAEGVVRLLAAYDDPAPINLMSRDEVIMEALVEAIAAHLGYTGAIIYDTTKPTGHRRRAFSTTLLQQVTGWLPSTPFAQGLRDTINWQVTHVALE